MKITFEIVFWGSLLDLAPNSSIPTSISLTFFRFFLWQNSSYIDVSKDLKVQFRVTRYEKDMKGSYLVHTWLVFGSYSHLFWSFDPSPSLHQGCIAHASGLGIHIISTWGKNGSVTSDLTTRPQSSMLVVLSNVAEPPCNGNIRHQSYLSSEPNIHMGFACTNTHKWWLTTSAERRTYIFWYLI
jgi:hypothetical protein